MNGKQGNELACLVKGIFSTERVAKDPSYLHANSEDYTDCVDSQTK